MTDLVAFDDRTLDVLFVPSWRFHTRPQVGLQLRLTWGELARWLSRPTTGNAKDEAGAWSPAFYRDSVRRKAYLVHACALVVDIDGAGDIDRACQAVGRYRAIVHETFSSTDGAPRCRVVLALAEWIGASMYERAHAIVRVRLRACGFGVDECAKDASRLSYSPVVRPGSAFRFAQTDGGLFDAAKVIAAQPPPRPRPAPKAPRTEHRHAYVRGALARARSSVLASVEPGRHDALVREATSLARLDVTNEQITDALLDAFVHVAGEGRRREGERVIRDQIRFRRQGAA